MMRIVSVIFRYYTHMAEPVNEAVSVDLLSNHLKKSVYPWIMNWRGRQYKMNKVGLHYMQMEGRTRMHLFSVTDGTSYFKLKFDTETLGWKLLEVESVQ
jgi:hypothetical protein